MNKLLKLLALAPLHLIRKIITVISNHAIPPKKELEIGVYRLYEEEQIRDSYNHFKKYFSEAIFLPTEYTTFPSMLEEIREYAINEAILNHKPDYYYLEFGVWIGTSINQSSEILKTLKDVKIYGFDSFEGLRDDWKGHILRKGAFNLSKQIPPLNDNCVPVVGWIEDTLPQFIFENKDLKINYVHIDTDTYPTAKIILQLLKPYLVNNAIILFDELYNFTGWRVGEYKALIEEFTEEEYKFLVFAKRGSQVVIQYNKI